MDDLYRKFMESKAIDPDAIVEKYVAKFAKKGECLQKAFNVMIIDDHEVRDNFYRLAEDRWYLDGSNNVLQGQADLDAAFYDVYLTIQHALSGEPKGPTYGILNPVEGLYLYKMDMRTYRDTTTFFGSEQLEYFSRHLTSVSDGDQIMLLMSIPPVYLGILTNNYIFPYLYGDNWADYFSRHPAAYDEFCEFLTKFGDRHVYIVAGDLHFGNVVKFGNFTQIVTSPITSKVVFITENYDKYLFRMFMPLWFNGSLTHLEEYHKTHNFLEFNFEGQWVYKFTHQGV